MKDDSTGIFRTKAWSNPNGRKNAHRPHVFCQGNESICRAMKYKLNKLSPQEYFEKIENAYSTLKSDVIREISIADFINSNICGCRGKEQKYWCEIKEIFYKKYKHYKNTF